MVNYGQSDVEVMKVSFLARNKSRLQELIDFAKVSGYRKLGVANCKGVQPYADKLVELLKEAGFQVVAVNCKESGLQACTLSDEMTGPSCDPLYQAAVLNEEKTELNINVGLCLGHGLLFQKYSHAPVTTFLVKDFATGHKTVENLSDADSD